MLTAPFHGNRLPSSTHSWGELPFSGFATVRSAEPAPKKEVSVTFRVVVMSGKINWILLCIVLLWWPTAAKGQINGFTQPFREIDLASDETGSIASIAVEAGSHVEKGQVIARLDDAVQLLQVEQADHQFRSTSALESAKRTLEKRQLITARIRDLINNGSATESELIRAELEESIARENFSAAQESAVGYEINLRRAQLMLERRLIRAPFSGVVSKIHQREGEFVSAMHPELVHLVQVDKLLAIFDLPSHQVNLLDTDKPITVGFHDGTEAQGTLYSVGVQTRAESGTIEVKILLDNQNGKLRSGEQCYLDITY